MTVVNEGLTEILLVEDNEADIRLTREVLADGKGSKHLNIVRDGDEAVAFLRRQPPYEHAPTPDLILLDLNLPRKDGREVLAEIKNDEALKRIPVVILTTSRAEADIVQTYELHANCYIVKPVDLSQFISVIRSIEDFWLKTVRMPGTH